MRKFNSEQELIDYFKLRVSEKEIDEYLIIHGFYKKMGRIFFDGNSLPVYDEGGEQKENINREGVRQFLMKRKLIAAVSRMLDKESERRYYSKMGWFKGLIKKYLEIDKWDGQWIMNGNQWVPVYVCKDDKPLSEKKVSTLNEVLDRFLESATMPTIGSIRRKIVMAKAMPDKNLRKQMVKEIKGDFAKLKKHVKAQSKNNKIIKKSSRVRSSRPPVKKRKR
jgi:hypothetical protein